MKIVVMTSALAAVAALSACSASVSEVDLKETARVATAKALQADPATAAIEITSVERGATSSSWSALYEGNHLTCSGNEKFQLPDCRVLQENAQN